MDDRLLFRNDGLLLRDDSLKSRIVPYIRYNPTDVVKMDYDTDAKLFQSFIDKDIDKVVYPPADIIFSNTIPLKDIEIEVDERGFIPLGQLIKYRVIIFEDFSSCYEKRTEIGFLIVFQNRKPTFIFSLGVEPGNNNIFALSGYSRINAPLFLNLYLNTWYAIQIMLLHPQVKTLFENPAKVPIHSNSQYVIRDRKVKYIKVHNICIDDVKKITRRPGEINRKCLVWYVIGHWREYKSGKKIFIQGYWKGQLKDIKRNIDNRTRIIDSDSLKGE